jgi:hypothetical protein
MRRALLLLAAALTLTACKVDAAVDVSMRPDGSGKVTLTVTADQDVVHQAPDLAADLKFDDATAAGWTVDGPVDTDVGGLQVVLTHEFATVEEATALLRSLNGTGGPLHDVTVTRTITKSEITTVLSGALRVDGGVDAFADPEVLAAIGGTPYADAIAATGLGPNDVITFRLTTDLPGKATTPGAGTLVDGTDDALSWSVPMDGTTVDLSSIFVQKQGRPSSTWGTIATLAFGALVVWCLLAGAFILFVANARRAKAMRRRTGYR